MTVHSAPRAYWCKNMARILGDVAAGSTLVLDFNTVDPSTKVPYTLAGTPAIGVWQDGTKLALGSPPTVIVDRENADAGSTEKTGSNWVVLNLSADALFTAGSDYVVKLTAGTVNGVSVAEQTIATFSIVNRETVLRDESLTVDKFATGLFATDADIVKKFGVTLVVAASPSPTTTGFSVDSAESLTNTQIDNAVALHLNTGRYTRITDITGTAVTISPALPAAPSADDEFVVFAQYLASL